MIVTNREPLTSANKIREIANEVIDSVHEQYILYVGKHGNDNNSGIYKRDAFLTFTAAINKAISLNPGPNSLWTS